MSTETTFSATVPAEKVPMGVQVWPSREGYESGFIVQSVAVTHRLDAIPIVTWTYVNGNQRTFRLGESVACRFSN